MNTVKVMEVEKPLWGKEEIIVNTDDYCGKKLHIREGHRFSLQFHKIKDETFYVEKGLILLEKGEDGEAEKNPKVIKHIVLKEGDIMRIPQYTIHRCGSLKGESTIIEVSTHHEDSDTYKLDSNSIIPQELMKKYNMEKYSK